MVTANQRTRNLRILLALCIGYALLVAVLSTLFPLKGHSPGFSFVWWLAGLSVCLIAYAVLEFAGTWSLERPFWRRLPSWARVSLLVAVVCLLWVSIAVVINLVRQRNAL